MLDLMKTKQSSQFLRGRGHFDGSRAECQRGSESTSAHLLHIGSYLSKAVPASWIPSTLHIK